MTLAPSPRESLRSLLDRALAEPIGIAVEVTGPSDRFQVRLCEAKESFGYESLYIARTADPQTIFILHRSVELE